MLSPQSDINSPASEELNYLEEFVENNCCSPMAIITFILFFFSNCISDKPLVVIAWIIPCCFLNELSRRKSKNPKDGTERPLTSVLHQRFASAVFCIRYFDPICLRSNLLPFIWDMEGVSVRLNLMFVFINRLGTLFMNK